MDTIGIKTPIVTAAPIRTAPIAPAAPALPKPAENITLPLDAPGSEAVIDLQAAEKRRADAVQRAAQQTANAFVVSDKTFTIFKDVTGQYITRFTSLRDGRVTYIPEPELLKASTSSGAGTPIVNIKA